MKLSTNWLQDYLSRTMSARTMADALEMAGVEVEQISSSSKLDKRIIVGSTTKVVQHPSADRLKLVTVETGSGEIVVVCGAPNVAKGQRVVLAQVGSVLPGGLQIEKASLRGVESNGMLCSEHELGWSDDHNGIALLQPGLRVGATLRDIAPADQILDISTPANRFDLLSLVGLAREVAAQTGTRLKEPKAEEPSAVGEALAVKIEAGEKYVQRYMLQRYEYDQSHGTNLESKLRLRASDMRPINLAVDITNYVMVEYGQPLHAFDAAKVKFPVVVRFAKPTEKLVTLDGVSRKLTARDLVIADSSGPIALAGVMGGASTSVDHNTRQVVIESATFDAATVRLMAQRHGLRTDASARFERGLPVQLAPLALNRAATIMKSVAHARATSPVTDELRVWPWHQHIGLRASRLSTLAGTPIRPKDIIENLQKLDFEARKFDIAKEAKKHLGKPYVWGASFKTHGTDGFDCSYLVDYLYSLIGIGPGHTALGQFQHGQPVEVKDLRPGDVVFYEGKIEKSAVDHYYTTRSDRTHQKHALPHEQRVGHNGIYIGANQVVHATTVELVKGQWLPRKVQGVILDHLDHFITNPGYLGARRYADNLEDFIAVDVPWWRPDVKLPEDLVEEVIGLIGYDKIPATLPAWAPTKFKSNRDIPQIWKTKDLLKAAGLFEVATYSFISQKQLEAFGYPPGDHLKLRNPLSQEQAYMRSNLLPSLLTAVSRNEKYKPDFGLFEVSKVFQKRVKGDLPYEKNSLGIIIRTPVDAYKRVKSVFDLLVRELNPKLTLQQRDQTEFAPSRAVDIVAGQKVIGHMGQLRPRLVESVQLDGEIGYAELDLKALLASLSPKTYQAVSRFPSIFRDLSLMVKQSVNWATVEAEVYETGLAKPTFLSDFTGGNLPEAHKSLAVRLEMSDQNRTLTDAEAEKRLATILDHLRKSTGAVPRIQL